MLVMIIAAVPEEWMKAILQGFVPFYNEHSSAVFIWDLQVTRLVKLRDGQQRKPCSPRGRRGAMSWSERKQLRRRATASNFRSWRRETRVMSGSSFRKIDSLLHIDFITTIH